MKVEAKEITFKDYDYNEAKAKYDSGNNIFWFVEIDILEHILSEYDREVEKYFFKNLKFFHSKTLLFEAELLTKFINTSFENSDYEEFDIFFKDFGLKFITDRNLKVEFFSHFEELYRLLYSFYTKQIEYILKVIDVFNKNKMKLEDVFEMHNDSELTDIRLGYGDVHESGVTTTLLLVNNKKIFLKQGVNHTKKYIELYNFFSTRLGYSSISLKSLDCNEFYFEETLTVTEIKSAKNLMSSLGINLFVAYILGLSDLHYENVIINDDKIVPIDCETVFNIKETNQREKPERGNYELAESVYTSYLLPFRKNNGLSLSGISSTDEVMTTKDYEIRKEKHGFVIENNITKDVKRKSSSLQNVKLIDYVDVVINAFRDAYLVYAENKKQIIDWVINSFNGKRKRVLEKDTSVYYDALVKSYKSYLMIDSVARHDFFFKTMCFSEKEVKCLFDNEIPTYHSEIKLDYDYFSKFTYEDMNVQSKLIETSINFECYGIKPRKSGNNPADEHMYYEYLCNELIILSSESFWLDSVDYKTDNSEISEIIIAPDTIYAGKSGICLFILEYLQKYNLLNEENRIHSFMRSLFSELEAMVDNKYSSCGLYDGTSGVFYVLYKYCNYADKNWKDELLIYLRKMISNVKYDTQFDIISGQVGFLKLLTYLVKNDEEEDFIIKGIEIMQDNLLYQIKDTEIFFAHNRYLGYSHGLIGIVSTLVESSQIIKINEIDSIVDFMVEYLTNVLDDEKGVPDSHKGSSFYNSWCHGNSGILLGLYNIYKVVKNERVLFLIKKLLRILKRDEDLDYKLCHGSFGKNLIAYNVSKFIGDDENIVDYKNKLDLFQSSLDKRMFKFHNKNFMTGLSGYFYWKLLDWNFENCLDLI